MLKLTPTRSLSPQSTLSLLSDTLKVWCDAEVQRQEHHAGFRSFLMADFFFFLLGRRLQTLLGHGYTKQGC